jgi:hypothetical protein
MTTEEGYVKDQVRKLLKEYGVYYLQPVQMGYGGKGVDFHCVVRWRDLPIAFFIETKAPSKDLTPLQKQFKQDRHEQQNATTFVISNNTGLRKLEQWLQSLQDQSSLLKVPSSTIIHSPPETL